MPQVFCIRFKPDGTREEVWGTPPPGFAPAAVGAGSAEDAIDWASRPVETSVLRNKPVGIIGASTSAFGTVWAQTELRKVLAAAGARVVGTEVPVTSC